MKKNKKRLCYVVTLVFLIFGLLTALYFNRATDSIYLMIEKGDIERVRLLVDENSEILNDIKEPGLTPLHWAVCFEQYGIVELLLQKGSSAKRYNEIDKVTPLHSACGTGHMEIVQLLLNYGADIDALTTEGRTPLFSASENGRSEVVSLLLEDGAQVNTKELVFEVTPLHLAAFGGHEEVAKLLLKFGADINAQSDEGVTPLKLAASNDKIEMVKLLVNNGADVNISDKSGRKPSDVAEFQGHDQIAEFLKTKE